ncbi:MAG: hypothetical protein JXA97_02740 [Anaerolineales bacterium]|nr:hypothetical protein [Anaerolineales bacterium]
MAEYQNLLWGFSLAFPDTWEKNLDGDAVLFSAPESGLSRNGAFETGKVMLRPEWNPEQTDIKKLWNLHIGKIAGVLGAKRVGASPWHMGDMKGMEAELVMPKKDPMRLWTGILARERIILHFMVTHHKLEREWFEPLATALIKSLRFHAPAAKPEPNLIFPIPPQFERTDPLFFIEDIEDPPVWQAFKGSASVGALQAFYARELPAAAWQIVAYDPIPGSSEPGFARFALQRADVQIILGILPAGGDVPPSSQPGIILLRQLSFP